MLGKIKKIDWFIIGNNLLLVLLTIFVYAKHNFKSYIFLLFLLLLIFFIRQKYSSIDTDLPLLLLSLFQLGILGHFAGESVFVHGIRLYDYRSFQLVTFDKIVHFYDLFIGLFIIMWLLERGNIISPLIFTGLIVLGMGVIVEIIEYPGFKFIPELGSRIGDYNNNMGDLVANFLGVLTAGFFATRPAIRGFLSTLHSTKNML